MLKIALCAAILFGLFGCSSVHTDVTVFHTADVEKPNTFNVMARGPGSDTLEAATYGDMVASRLQGLGWTRQPAGEVTVVYGFGIDSGREVTRAAPIYGQTGGGSSTSTGMITGSGGFATYSGTTYTQPTFGLVGAVPVTETVYERVFVMNMYNSADGKKVYESTVTSRGESGSFSAVAQCLVDALFQDFPGGTSQHKKIVMDGSKCVLQ